MDKGKNENEIQAILVIPHTERFYDYYINGEADRRTMLRDDISEFCISLCHAHTSEINKCVFEMRPFILYPQSGEFNELKENPPPKINRRKLLFPDCTKILAQKQAQNEAKDIAKNFSIWNQFGIHIETMERQAHDARLKMPFV